MNENNPKNHIFNKDAKMDLFPKYSWNRLRFRNNCQISCCVMKTKTPSSIKVY